MWDCPRSRGVQPRAALNVALDELRRISSRALLQDL